MRGYVRGVCKRVCCLITHLNPASLSAWVNSPCLAAVSNTPFNSSGVVCRAVTVYAASQAWVPEGVQVSIATSVMTMDLRSWSRG